MKNFLKARLNPLVWERLGQAKQEYFWTRKTHHCESDLIPFFNKYLSYENGYYVDVGAFDGRSSSNTYHLEKSLGCGGVLIEPIMHQYFRSKQIRSSHNKFFNAACVSKDYKEDTVELLYSASMSTIVTRGGEEKALAWAEEGAKYLSRAESVERTWSQARTLESILVESNSPRTIDLLSIDVEGNELAVLEGIDFSLWKFKYIIIETKENSEANKLLQEHGYIHLGTVGNNVCLKRSV